MRGYVENRVFLDKLENNVVLVGFQKDPYSIMKGAKILLLPSKWEGFGLVTVETLALGLPVVCSSVGGLPNIVNDACGRLCETQTEFVKEIFRLLNDQSLLK